MRLIDGDVLIEEIRNKIPVYRGRNTFMSFVGDMPTAYYPEKVVVALEEISEIHCEEYHKEEGSLYLQDVIKIVRKGGVE